MLNVEVEAQSIPFNKGWLFVLADVPSASDPAYDDAHWRNLDVPHDWAFENGYSPQGAQGDKGGYAMGGVGWYRKHFTLPPDQTGRRLFLDFDAVYMNSEVWINGHKLGKRPYGYVSFSYEITDYVSPGENVVSVRVDNSLEPSARWYHGCGIYGEVHLRMENDLFFVRDGIHVRTPEIGSGQASVLVHCELSEEQQPFRLCARIVRDGKTVSQAEADSTPTLRMSVAQPHLWSPDTPELYLLQLELIDAEGRLSDREEIRFGFRTIDWDAERGFFLNGENLKLRGVCEHLEGGPVGAMWNKSLLAWKLRLLKEMGCNAIRTAHNPQLPVFYDLCDELGILVLDEFFDGWSRKAAHDYGAQAFAELWERDLRATIRRDRNHPSVFLYSMGNETGGAVAADLVRVCHEEDPDRMVTSGHSGSSFMNVFGVNGNSEKKSFLTTYVPGAKAFIGTETPHAWQVRGFYRTQTWYRDGYPNKQQSPFEIPNLTETEIFGYDWTDPRKKTNSKQLFNSSYDNATVRLTARHNLEILRDSSWYSGHFRWTGFDYPGEAGYVHGGWPFWAFMGGVLDLAGFRKDHYYLYQSQWREEDLDMVHLLPHWTHPDMTEGTLIPVWVYTTGDEAELFLNGESLGRRKKGKAWHEMQCEWRVPYRPGELKATAYRNGRKIAETTLRTASSPAAFRMEISDRFAADSLFVVDFSMHDRLGWFHPFGENRIWLSMDGRAEVLSFENGSPVDTQTNFRATDRRLFFGLARAFVRYKEPGCKVWAGAICGDKSFKQSDTIAICVRRLDPESAMEALTPQGLEIRYTLDGREPGPTSALYDGPIRLDGKAEVKAVAYLDGASVLRMSERFGYADGIYWGAPETAIISSHATSVLMADVEGGEYVNVGDDACVMLRPEGRLEWYQENDGGAFDAELAIHCYATGKESTLLVSVNEQKPTLCTVSAESPANQALTLSVPCRIRAGANRITVSVPNGISPKIRSFTIN